MRRRHRRSDPSRGVVDGAATASARGVSAEVNDFIRSQPLSTGDPADPLHSIVKRPRVVGSLTPGFRVIIPFVDVMHRVTLRISTMPIQSQGIITRDNVSVDVSAVADFRVVDAVKSVVAIENVYAAIDQIAQTTLRKVFGQHTPHRGPGRKAEAVPEARAGPALRQHVAGLCLLTMSLDDDGRFYPDVLGGCIATTSACASPSGAL